MRSTKPSRALVSRRLNNFGVFLLWKPIWALHGEYRYARLAPLADGIYIAIFTFRAGPVIRLISARKATAKETEFYEQSKK